MSAAPAAPLGIRILKGGVIVTPLEMLTTKIRAVLSAGAATREETETLRQLAIHVIDHDTTTTAATRAALRDVLDTANRPDATSWQTDSGLGASRGR